MTQRNTQLRDTIKALLKADRSLSLQQLAAQGGVTKARAQQVVKDMGYEFQPGKPAWVRKKRKG